MPAVSVIVPMYNAEPYIGECLSSLLRQTLESIEVICVNDGSADNTLEVARQIVEEDERFSFVSQDNKGLSASRNAGIIRAKGEYVLFLDADDYLEPHALERLFTQASSKALDVLFFSARTIYEGVLMRGVYRDEYTARKNINGVMSGQQLLMQFQSKESFSASAAMQLLRRDFLNEAGVRFYEGILQEDNLFTCLTLAYAKRAAYLNEPLYVRRVHADSIMTSKKTIKHVYGHFKCAYELERWLVSHVDSCEPGFFEALLAHVSVCYAYAARESWELSPGELLERANCLPAEERLRFIVDVIGNARSLGEIKSEYADSTTFRVGSAIMKLPCWLKENLKR